MEWLFTRVVVFTHCRHIIVQKHYISEFCIIGPLYGKHFISSCFPWESNPWPWHYFCHAPWLKLQEGYEVEFSSKLCWLSFITKGCFPVIVNWSHQSVAARPIHLSWLNRETSWIGCLNLNVWPITSLIANTRWAYRHSGSGADRSSLVERGAVNQPWLGMWRLGRG